MLLLIYTKIMSPFQGKTSNKLNLSILRLLSYSTNLYKMLKGCLECFVMKLISLTKSKEI